MRITLNSICRTDDLTREARRRACAASIISALGIIGVPIADGLASGWA
jgi:hypothetical protein